jgi:hypothetical protein
VTIYLTVDDEDGFIKKIILEIMIIINYAKNTLQDEVASSSETSVNIYQITQCYIPEDSHLYSRRRENLKSHKI